MRQLRALCIVAALVLAAPIIDAVLPEAGASASDAVVEAPAGIASSLLTNSASVDEALVRLESLASPDETVPSWFEREVGFLPGARDIRASGPVVGYVVDGESSAAMVSIQARMAERGWTCVSLGGVEGATFAKPSGVCTWVLVTCTQVDGATSVVARGNVS